MNLYFPLLLTTLAVNLILFFLYSSEVRALDHYYLYTISFLPYYCVTYFALLYWGNPEKPNQSAVRKLQKSRWPAEKKLIVSFVSKGENLSVLQDSVDAAICELNLWCTNYEIEIITDNERPRLNLPEHKEILYCVVPSDYLPPNNSLFKARARHYALSERKQRLSDLDNTWILHLDEESTLSGSVLAGIAEFISSDSTTDLIGQGEIQYNSRNYGDSLIPTAMDSMRTGHDLGYFRFQYNFLHKPLFGVHGSFLLVPALIEHGIGFDYGPKASVTEDLFFALKAVQEGHRFSWVNGVIHEQSPTNLSDIIRQRKRWINGITYVLLDKRLNFCNRLCVGISLGLWRSAFILAVAPLFLIFWDPGKFKELLYINAIIYSLAITTYLIGAYRNIDRLDWSKLKKIKVTLQIVLLTPLSIAIETFALATAIIRPTKNFYVVEKN